jgi:putative FmdB family regulatory protein
MPLFEYSCRSCGERFETFVTQDRSPACPSCHSDELQKLLSIPGMVTAGGGSKTVEPLPGCRAQGGHCACAHED